jgi:hypothetical protein
MLVVKPWVLPILIVMLVIATSSPACRAQAESGDQESDAPDPHQEQVDAATARAVRDLLEQVAETPIDDRMTVREFLDRTRGEEEMIATLQRAEQIGGPRWIDEQTCQVQLEISGVRVARALSRIAASQPKESPISAEVLEVRLADWRSRRFSTTGASTAAQHAERIMPPAGNDRWSRVSDEARRQAVGDAKYDAVMNVFDSIADIQLDQTVTVGNALSDETIVDHVHRWFASRPVTDIEFRDNLEIEIALAAPPREIAGALRAAMSKQKTMPRLDDEQWERVSQEIIAAAEPAVGRGRIAMERNDEELPDQVEQAEAVEPSRWRADDTDPPKWVEKTLRAEGSARREASKLRSARAAESDALEKLDAEVRRLRLDKSTSLDEAAKAEPAVDDAIVRSLRRAKAVKTDYNGPDKSVIVVVEFNLRDLWEELRRAGE